MDLIKKKKIPNLEMPVKMIAMASSSEYNKMSNQIVPRSISDTVARLGSFCLNIENITLS